MDKERQLRLLRKAFSDISRGYSIAFFEDKKLFIKHLSHHEQVDLDVLYHNFLDDAIKEGVPTEKEILERLKEEKIWDESDEEQLKKIQATIERLVAGKKVIFRKSELDHQNNLIKEEEVKYQKKQLEKDKLLGLTAEAFAEKKVNEHYIIGSFFINNDFSKKFLTEDIYDDLSEADMQRMIRLYNEEMEVVSDRNVKKLALQDFFQIYWSLSSENLHHFFGKPICDLTYFQVKLGSYGRMFKNILEKSEGIPEEIKEDPDKLMDYVRAGENAKSVMEKAAQGSPDNEVQASTVFGMDKNEMESIGVKNDPGTSSLSQELKKNQAKGKKGLDMQDMMRLLGA